MNIPDPKVAVLYRAARPPIIDGVVKPMKPGGYADSGADIAFALRSTGISVITPTTNPDPMIDLDWVFADDAVGLHTAIERGATTLWANTVLFAGHPLEDVLSRSYVVGQHPARVQQFDDKWATNELLRAHGLPVASSLLIGLERTGRAYLLNQLTQDLLEQHGINIPVVVKPVRGRGSQGVTRVETLEHLRRVAEQLLYATETVHNTFYSVYGSQLIVEEYLPGEELTLTVMPPGSMTSAAFNAHLPLIGHFRPSDVSTITTALRHTMAWSQ